MRVTITPLGFRNKVTLEELADPARPLTPVARGLVFYLTDEEQSQLAAALTRRGHTSVGPTETKEGTGA